MTVLRGLKFVQIGDGLAAAVCGRLFADLGAEVTAINAANDTSLAKHLNADKTTVDTLPFNADLIVVEGAPAALQSVGYDAPSLREVAPDIPLVFISPFGQTGPDANRPASDLILFCASGIARCLTGQVDDLSEPPIRPIGEQSAFIGGLAAGCAGIHAVLKDGPSTVDVSIQEALATLSMTELTKAGLGGIGWSRKRFADGNGATVCILPAVDGYVAISPREDHQWAAWLKAMGNPAWGVEPRYRTKPDRIKHWDTLHALMSDWSRNYRKQSIADMAQSAHVPSFPLREPSEHLNSPQLIHRNSFQTRHVNNKPLKTILNPFGLTLYPGEKQPARISQGSAPLAGIRVLDFSWVIAGPTTTRYLAAMGAEVIKVEAPGLGDPGRASELHTVLGQAKRGIVLNLKHHQAKLIARELAARSDILIENFATGVMERLSLGAEDLLEANPNLIYISASGMGRSGPEANAVAYGTLLQCYAGFAALNRHAEITPRVGMAWLDPMCGLKLAFIAAAALWRRRNKGGGTRVDFSMIEAMLWTMAAPLIEAQTGGPAKPGGNQSSQFTPHGVYRCRGEDDWIGLSISNSQQWLALCLLIPDLTPYRYMEYPDRLKNCNAIDLILDAFISQHTAPSLTQKLSDAGISASTVATTSDLVSNRHLNTRGFWDAANDGVLPGLPWRSDLGRTEGPAPKLGEHTANVLRDVLAMGDGQIEAFRGDGVFG